MAQPKRKGIGLRILLGIAGVAVGLAVQVVGSTIAMLTGAWIVELFLGLLGFGVMGYLIYKWAIK